MQQFHSCMSNKTACTLSLVCQAVTMIYGYAGVYLTIVCFHGQADAGKNAGIFIEKTVISLLPQCNRAWWICSCGANKVLLVTCFCRMQIAIDFDGIRHWWFIILLTVGPAEICPWKILFSAQTIFQNLLIKVIHKLWSSQQIQSLDARRLLSGIQTQSAISQAQIAMGLSIPSFLISANWFKSFGICLIDIFIAILLTGLQFCPLFPHPIPDVSSCILPQYDSGNRQ